MSFDTYMKSKSQERESGSTFHSSKKAKKKEDKEVAINIGIKKLVGGTLKNIRGKCLSLTVPQSATYALILKKAVDK